MANKVKKKLRAGSSTRSYLAKDFESFRQNLIEQAGIFFPDKIQDFSEASVAGMLVDVAATVADTMSFYLDHQFRELDPQSAVETESVLTHLRNAGVEIYGAAPSVADIVVTIKVPAFLDTTLNKYVPKASALPIILEGTTLSADNGVVFNLTEDLDFAAVDVLGNIVPDYVTSKTSDGVPTQMEVSLNAVAISGKETQHTVTLPDTHVPFREITLCSV